MPRHEQHITNHVTLLNAVSYGMGKLVATISDGESWPYFANAR